MRVAPRMLQRDERDASLPITLIECTGATLLNLDV